MRRWHAILTNLPMSQKLNNVSEGAEVLYRRILDHCDDNGNYWGDPVIIAGQLFPHRMAHKQITPEDVESRLNELFGPDVQLIVAYQVGHERYVHVVKHFHAYQRKDGDNDTRFPDYDGVDDSVDADVNGRVASREEKRREEKRRKEPPAHAVAIAQFLASENPNIKQQTDATIQKWANQIDTILRNLKNSDGSLRWTPERMKAAIKWACRDDFWCKRLLSPKNLKSDFLWAQFNERGKKGGGEPQFLDLDKCGL